MTALDIDRLLRRLESLHAIALLERTSSTNDIGRRVLDECIENEIPLPAAVIVAREQWAGRGRGARSWHSPAGNGIYATTLHSRPGKNLAALPLEVAVIVAEFLRETYRVDARIKWPNDILIGSKKIAGILIEARIHEDQVYALIGTGINITPFTEDVADSTTLAAESTVECIDVDSATEAFIEFIDTRLSSSSERAEIIERWSKLTIHEKGDRIVCRVGDQVIEGRWVGVDDFGCALLRQGDEIVRVSGGDLYRVEGA
ncbi:MAG: biotin--[acetyl-CoA-carboxylase] ligase [Thermoanaerobaculia bacterium]